MIQNLTGQFLEHCLNDLFDEKINNIIITHIENKRETQKVIICFFGVVPRSIRYTHNNLKKNLIDVVKSKYEVDIYTFNNFVDNTLVDCVDLCNNDIKFMDMTFFEEEKQSDIDIKNQKIVDSDLCNMWSDKYRKNRLKNSLRQMYSEEKVGLFLEKNINDYKCAIVCGPDYYLLNNINLEHVEKSINNLNSVYTTRVNDGQGYTNGFYIGSIQPMIHILKRYSMLEQLLPTDKDYEFLLKEAFRIHEVNRLITDTVFIKIRNNQTIARQGIMKQSKFIDPINDIKSIIKYIG
jgi:hypothetical protein